MRRVQGLLLAMPEVLIIYRDLPHHFVSIKQFTYFAEIATLPASAVLQEVWESKSLALSIAWEEVCGASTEMDKSEMTFLHTTYKSGELLMFGISHDATYLLLPITQIYNC